jgi:hypothetical protein
MAHFAKLIGNKVVDVIVVHNNELLDNGIELEQKGIQFLKSLYGQDTNWKQTSYNGNLRKNYAGIGSIYDETRDAFIPQKLYNSWILNENTCQWEAPIARPQDGNKYKWNEQIQNWELING